ncbi:hypothetical protein BD310DRAFT_126891 [Dichomitus squalens]|uniref:Uncharacterized protein n=1 Tax=Dichomitus squalens TaxID=114155 RepID=A0A4V2K6X0_9APHY|nr:hypothetical protein BD310DRAFT_126891 [Dichomitus squalens]
MLGPGCIAYKCCTDFPAWSLALCPPCFPSLCIEEKTWIGGMYGTTEPIAQFYTSRYPEIAVEGRDTDSVTGVTGGVESSLGQP